MGLDVIGDLGNPAKDAAAFQPVIDEAVERAAKAFGLALQEALVGLTVTIQVSKK